MKAINAVEKVKHLDDADRRDSSENLAQLGLFLLFKMDQKALERAYREACAAAKQYERTSVRGSAVWYPHYLQIAALLEAELVRRGGQ